MARATPLQKPYGTSQKGAVEADSGFNNHVAGDSGFGRPVKRPTRFKDLLKQFASPQRTVLRSATLDTVLECSIHHAMEA